MYLNLNISVAVVFLISANLTGHVEAQTLQATNIIPEKLPELLTPVPGYTSGSIQGIVTDSKTGDPLPGVNLILSDTYLGAVTNQAGRFEITQVQPGRHKVVATMMGYEPAQISGIVSDGDSYIEIKFVLEQNVISLDEIVVSPGHFSMLEKIPSSRHSLSAEEIHSFPQLGEDIYRAISRLPGISSNDIAAGFYIRGGQQNETLVLIDGMEIFNPFHLKIQDGFLSFIDVEAIRGIEMMTGAFPADYGNRLSGVFSLKTITTQPHRKRTSLAISFLNTRFISENSFAQGRGQWTLVARRGYIDLLLQGIDQDVDAPVYYDILGKLHYSLNPRHSLSAHILMAFDRWDGVIDPLEFKTRNDNSYTWLTLLSQWNSDLKSRTLVSSGGYGDKLFMNATNTDDKDERDSVLNVMDQRVLHFFGLKQDWTLNVSDNHILRWGYDAKNYSSHINYYHRDWVIKGLLDTYFTSGYNIESRYSLRDGIEFSGYLADRFRLGNPVAVEIGLRYDQSNWTNDSNWSPRINLVYNLAGNSSIRLGWGYYYQTQSLTQGLGLYGDSEFYPAERSEHRVIGFEHELSGGNLLRVEAYQKVLTGLRPHYITWGESTLRPIPMVDEDRVRLEPEGGEALGLEFYLSRENGHAFNYWFSYTLSKTRERIEGHWIPRFNDQLHTVYCDLSWTPNVKWRFNLAWQYHTGWPYTLPEVIDLHLSGNGSWDWRLGPGPLYTERFPAYNRADLRINRSFQTKHGRLTGFIEIRNVLNTYNPRKYLYNGVIVSEPDGSDEPEISIQRYETNNWLGLLPSFGIKWDLL